jgi:uncharacterized repeat protein (TIGR03943 family)
MNRWTQGLLLAFLGAVLLRISLSDAYLRYVTEWMKWPIAVSGAILLLLAVGPVLRQGDDEDDHGHHAGASGGGDHGVPFPTWLLVLPGLVAFVISPPELGSFLAERRATDAVAVARPAVVNDLDADGPVPVDVTEFIWRAQDGGESLEGQPVVLTGFVSHDPDDASTWYVTRLTIGCCAADASAYRVAVDGDVAADRPERDQWVEVTGTYASGTGVSVTEDPVLTAEQVLPIETPRQTYE